MSSAQLRHLMVVDAQILKSDWEQRLVILMDVREATKFAQEDLPDAILNLLSQFDCCQIPQVEEMPVVMSCHSGHRFAIAAPQLLDIRLGSVAAPWWLWLSGFMGARLVF